jgi:hypothetical protein
VTARQHIARALRKWADLIDPRTNPRNEMTITITADTSQLDAATEESLARLRELSKALAKIGAAA